MKRALFVILLIVFSIQACSKKDDEISIPGSDTLKNLDYAVIISPEAYVRIAPYVFSSKIYDLYNGDTVRIIDQ